MLRYPFGNLPSRVEQQTAKTFCGKWGANLTLMLDQPHSMTNLVATSFNSDPIRPHTQHVLEQGEKAVAV